MKMTVYELIERLKTHDPTARVVVAGYENGLDGIVEVIALKIAPRKNPNEYDGEFRLNRKGEAAVYLGKGNRALAE
jgi:hypothetical protein